MAPHASTPTVQPSAMPVVALVLAILGVCLPPLLLVAIVLAIISLVKSGEPAFATRKGLAIVALVVPIAVVPVMGILAAIAIPNFIHFQARSKQSECKTNLKAVFMGEKARYLERDEFSPFLQHVGFLPERGNRYGYYLDLRGPFAEPGGSTTDKHVGIGPDSQRYPGVNGEAYAASVSPDVAAEVGVQGQCPDCTFTAVCVGNVDSDPTLDVWTISSQDRVGPMGEAVPAGQPLNHVNDVTD